MATKNKQAESIRARKRKQSGATMVEAAVIFLPFFALWFALFDFGMALFLKNTMQFAVRQGVRYAVTSQTASGMGQDASIKSVVNTYSFGFLGYLTENSHCSGTGVSGDPGTACITINYYHQDTTTTPPTITQVGTTGTGGNDAGNICQVVASSLTYNWMIPLMRSANAYTFTVSSADIMEAQPGGAPTR